MAPHKQGVDKFLYAAPTTVSAHDNNIKLLFLTNPLM